jgi:hypothetical protein
VPTAPPTASPAPAGPSPAARVLASEPVAENEPVPFALPVPAAPRRSGFRTGAVAIGLIVVVGLITGLAVVAALRPFGDRSAGLGGWMTYMSDASPTGPCKATPSCKGTRPVCKEAPAAVRKPDYLNSR